MIADADVDPECRAAWEDASRLLESLGHEVEDVAVPMPPEAVPTFETCWAVLTALSAVPPEHASTCCVRSPAGSATGAGAVSGPEFGLAIGEMRRVAADA